MFLNKRRQWALVAGFAGVAAAQITEQMLTSSWRLAAGKEPPGDPAYEDVDWSSAVLWTAAAGAAAGLTQLFARHGAGVVWQSITGRRPPRPKRRRKRKALR